MREWMLRSLSESKHPAYLASFFDPSTITWMSSCNDYMARSCERDIAREVADRLEIPDEPPQLL